MKRCFVFLGLIVLIASMISFSAADSQKISCDFVFEEETAQIGKPFSFSYSLSGGSGSYTDVSVEAEFVTVHDYSGSDVDDQYCEKGELSSGTVTFTPVAGTAIILWLRGYDAVTHEYFYFECHQGWVSIEPNPIIAVEFQCDQDEAVIGEQLSVSYTIDSNYALSEIESWWLVGGEGFSSEHSNEQILDSSSGTLSTTPSHGDYIYLVIEGETTNGDPFYAESEHFTVINSGIEKIACTCTFPEDEPQIGKPYSFSYELTGGSGLYSDLNVEAEFVTVHDFTGRDVDDQRIELGTAASGTVTFTPTAGTAIILWLRGKDATTQQSFYFECHEGWLSVLPNPDYPVSFAFDKAGYLAGETITANYRISNCNNEIVDGKLWWLLVTDFNLQDHIDMINITEATGTAETTPSYGTYVYAVLEGKDNVGNPIYAESEHLNIENADEITEVFVLPKSLQSVGKEAFYGTAVKKVIMPAGLTITNIAFDAFQNTPLKVIYGNSEDARTYALEHGVLYAPIE